MDHSSLFSLMAVTLQRPVVATCLEWNGGASPLTKLCSEWIHLFRWWWAGGLPDVGGLQDDKGREEEGRVPGRHVGRGKGEDRDVARTHYRAQGVPTLEPCHLDDRVRDLLQLVHAQEEMTELAHREPVPSATQLSSIRPEVATLARREDLMGMGYQPTKLCQWVSSTFPSTRYHCPSLSCHESPNGLGRSRTTTRLLGSC